MATLDDVIAAINSMATQVGAQVSTGDPNDAANAADRAATSAERQLAAAQAAAAASTDLTEQLELQENILEKEAELEKAKIEAIQIRIEGERELAKQQGEWNASKEEAFQRELDNIQDRRDASTEFFDSQKKASQEQSKIETEIAEKRKKGLDDALGAAGGFANALGMSNTTAESTLGKFQGMGNAIKNATGPELEALQAQLGDMFNMANFASSIFDKVVESTLMASRAYDSMTASLNAATGAAGRFNREIEFATLSTGALGIGTEELGSAYTTLITDMANFTSLSKAQRQEVGVVTANLEKLGVSSATTASNLEFLTKSMGLSAEQAVTQQKELAEFANTIGVAPANLAEGFKAAQPIMVKFGKEVGDKVFKNLAKAAKATGIEMSSLLGIAGQFDTFEASAQAAGKLNALLGGPMLNSVELLTAREDERIQMLRMAVQQSGRNFNSMNRFEQQAIASAAGISDMTEAAKLFGTTDEEFNVNAEAQANLAEMTEKAQNMQDKLNQVMMKFAPLVGFVVDRLSSLLTIILDLSDDFPVFTKIVSGLILAIGSLIVATNLATLAQIAMGNSIMMNMALKSLDLILMGLLKVAIIVYTVGTYLAAAATFVFGGALWALLAPLLPIIAAITAVVAVVTLLIVYWDELTAGVQNLTGGMFDMWDVLLLGIPIIGQLVMAGRFLSNNWEAIVSDLTELWQSFASFMSGMWKGIVDSAKAPLNFLARMFNQTLGSLSITFPSWMGPLAGETFGVPQIPMLAQGGTISASGMAIVGEKGPELVSLPANSSVTPNSELRGATVARTTSTQSQSPTTVILQLNEREFARAVVKVLDKKLNLSTGN